MRRAAEHPPNALRQIEWSHQVKERSGNMLRRQCHCVRAHTHTECTLPKKPWKPTEIWPTQLALITRGFWCLWVHYPARLLHLTVCSHTLGSIIAPPTCGQIWKCNGMCRDVCAHPLHLAQGHRRGVSPKQHEWPCLAFHKWLFNDYCSLSGGLECYKTVQLLI